MPVPGEQVGEFTGGVVGAAAKTGLSEIPCVGERITTIEAANRFLKEEFLPGHNERFTRAMA